MIDADVIRHHEVLQDCVAKLEAIQGHIAWGVKQVDPAARNAVAFSAVQEVTVVLRQMATILLREHRRVHGGALHHHEPQTKGEDE